MPLTQMNDSGCSITGGVNSLSSYGVCPENLWPFEPNMINYPPNQNVYRSAKEEAVKWKPFQVPIDLNSMKSTLAKGYPFVCAVNLFRSFTTAKNGYVPLPQQDEVKKPTETR